MLLYLQIACSFTQKPRPANTDTLRTIETLDLDFSKMDRYLKREEAYGHFSGVVMIMKDDKAVYAYASNGLPVGLDSRFDVGSISKQFTSAAILSLVHKGQLEVSDPINNHLGQYASKRWKDVTVHHLLTHTSGIPSIYQTEQGLEVFFPESNPTTLDYLVSKFYDKKLLFKPGEEFSYSNSGYVLLAMIIENISGNSFPEFMKDELFDRYNLVQTGFNRDSNCAFPGFGYRNDLYRPAEIHHPSWSYGAGGVYSTASDLLRWSSIIQSDTFLTKDLQEEYLDSHTRVGYGYGWQVDKYGIIQHDGATTGFISFLSIDPGAQVSIVALTNRSFENVHMYGKSVSYVKTLVEDTWSFLKQENMKFLPEIRQQPLSNRKYSENGSYISLSPKSDSTIAINYSVGPITRLIANSPLHPEDSMTIRFIEQAEALEHSRYWKLAKHSNGEMKFVCYSGLMRIGMNMIKKKTGTVKETIPYLVTRDYGLIRMKGELGNLDLITYYDEDGLLQGIFENEFLSPDEPSEQVGYVVNENTVFVDGLPYGEKSCILVIDENSLRIRQSDREIVYGN